VSAADAPGPSAWSDALLGAGLFAIDPVGLGGVSLRALPGPARDRWLERVAALLPRSTKLRRVPLHVEDGRLLGGLDLAATLRAGRPVVERGILAESDGGVVVLAMAERLPASTAARLGHVLDSGEIVLERDGLAGRSPARFGVVALDEGIEADERPPAVLLDRLALHLDLSGVGAREAVDAWPHEDEVAAARERLADVTSDDEMLRALCEAAMALGIETLRAPWLALRAARAVAALSDRSAVLQEDAATAARLVLAPRARALPGPEPPEEQESPETEPRDETEPEGADAERGGDEDEAPHDGDPAEVVLESAKSAIPSGLLEQIRLAGGARSRSQASGKAGARRQSTRRGRPAGVRRGEPGAGARLNVIETLRAAAPWQPLRRAERARGRATGHGDVRVEVRRDDFRVTRYRHRSETTVLFAVDASGSSALQRLAEAKGAIEMLLAECYVRRDQVSLLTFRGDAAEVLLPPTRSLVRAKRGLAALPGGGGTPLAAGIDAAADLARGVIARGATPLVVLLTDGRANVARSGIGGRAQAEEDAVAAARRLRADGVGALLVDTSTRPQPQAQRLASEMGASYLPLPRADSSALCEAVRQASTGEGSGPRGPTGGAARR